MSMEFPVLRFEALAERTEDALKRYIWDKKHSMANGFLVCLRMKYAFEKEWGYLIEFCRPYDGDGIMWDMDWWEGQQDVEYLGICEVPGWGMR